MKELKNILSCFYHQLKNVFDYFSHYGKCLLNRYGFKFNDLFILKNETLAISHLINKSDLLSDQDPVFNEIRRNLIIGISNRYRVIAATKPVFFWNRNRLEIKTRACNYSVREDDYYKMVKNGDLTTIWAGLLQEISKIYHMANYSHQTIVLHSIEIMKCVNPYSFDVRYGFKIRYWKGRVK